MCAHTKQTIDYLVWNLMRPEQVKQEAELAKAGIMSRVI